MGLPENNIKQQLYILHIQQYRTKCQHDRRNGRYFKNANVLLEMRKTKLKSTLDRINNKIDKLLTF